MFCILPEDDKHMLFSCKYKADIWFEIFKIYIGSPSQVSLHQLYRNIATLNLDLYTILSLDLKVNIFDIFATTMRHIWRSHWMFFYEQVPFDEQCAPGPYS
jgi:hypothetical protein